jgi:predicted CopG family antitoxin
MARPQRLRKAERRSFSTVLQDILNRLAVWASAKRTIDGTMIVFSKHKGNEAPDKVAAALQLIRNFDPRSVQARGP